MIRRARLIAVVSILLAGAVGIVSSTQTWIGVTLADGAGEDLLVPGASAVPVLAPLSLAVLALGAALSIVGVVLRYVLGALTTVAGVLLVVLTSQVVFTLPTTAVAATVTEATGITGAEAVAALVEALHATVWPVLALAGWCVLVAAGLLVLATARRWRAGGRKYDAAPARSSGGAVDAPLDAIDSWDDLSRGDDPTRPGPHR